MADPTQFTWRHKELVELLVKEAGLHEGRWWLMVNFAMGPGNFGPSEEQINPGMVVGIGSIGIQREMPDQKAPSGLVVDAAEVNPAPASGTRARTRAKG